MQDDNARSRSTDIACAWTLDGSIEAMIAALITGVLWFLAILVFYIGSSRRGWERATCVLIGCLICVGAPLIGILGVFRFVHHLNIL